MADDLPRNLWATSSCCGMTFTFTLYTTDLQKTELQLYVTRCSCMNCKRENMERVLSNVKSDGCNIEKV